MKRISFFGTEIILSYKLIAFLSSLTAVILFIAGYFIIKNNTEIEFVNDSKILDETDIINTKESGSNTKINENSADAQQNIKQEEKTETVMVYVTGCVKNPGIVELEKGSIINDAINACGGFTEDANKNINLVYEINNNMTIKVKQVNQAQYENMQNGIEIIDDTGQMFLNGSPVDLYNGIININTASVEQLCVLSGIGEATARQIVEYRSKNGAFLKIEDIMNVPGIKIAKFNQIKDYITVG